MKSLYNKYIRENSNSIKKLMGVVFVFGFLKLIAFLAPLGMALSIASNDIYGEFEYVINLGLMFSGLFSGGLVGAFGYFILKKGNSFLKPVFHTHFVTLVSLITLFAIFNPSLLDNSFFGAVILGIAFADQLVIAAILKGNSMNKLAVVSDTGIYLIMGGLVFLIYIQTFNYSHKLWHISILLYLIGISIFYHLPRSKNVLSIKKKDVFKVYKFGVLVLIAGPLLVLISNSTRLFIEYFGELGDVGIYSIHFRISALVLIIYRIAGILLFRSFFVSEHRQLDKRYSLLIIILVLFNIGSFLTLPLIESTFFESILIDWKVYLLCIFQVTFWINLSLLESAFQREGQMKKFILLLIFSSISLIGVMFLISQFLSLSIEFIVFLNTLIIFLTFYGQLFILKSKGIYYPRTLKTHTILGLLFVFTSSFVFIFYQ